MGHRRTRTRPWRRRAAAGCCRSTRTAQAHGAGPCQHKRAGAIFRVFFSITRARGLVGPPTHTPLDAYVQRGGRNQTELTPIGFALGGSRHGTCSGVCTRWNACTTNSGRSALEASWPAMTPSVPARKRAVIYCGWVFFFIWPGSPHVRPMGRKRPRDPGEVAAFMTAHSTTPCITPSMGIPSGKGVVRGRGVQQLAFA